MDYALILVSGFFASLHCIGMCGAIVLAYSTQHTGSKNSGEQQGAAAQLKAVSINTLPLHLLYNGGRVFSYTLLGAVMGLIGGMVASFKNAASYASIVSGVIMVTAGILMLNIIPLPSSRLVDKLGKISAKTFGRVIREPSKKSKFVLGVLTPLFPCGILYAMLFKAGATQDILSGALVMMLFGLGMAPALILTGTATSLISSRLRAIGDKIAAVTIILMGVILLLRGFGIPFLHIFGGGRHHG